jgi:tetratricopeptide (TPR) repeat protein
LRLELGPGYQPRLPVPVAVKRDYAEYSGAYKLDGRVFLAERTLQIRNSSVPAERSGDVAAFTRVVSSDDAQKLGLEIAAAAAGVTPDLKATDLIRTGYEALGNQNYTQAIALLKRAVELEPKDKKAWNYLGQAYVGAREYEPAVAAFGEQLKVDAYDEHAWNNIAHARTQQGRFEDAERAFRKQLEMNPLDKFAQRGLGRVLVETRRWADAVPQLTQAISLGVDDPMMHTDLGTAYLNLSKDTEALAAFAKAVELSPTPNTWNNIAYQLSLKGAHLDRALQYAESAVTAVAAASRNLTLDHISTRELDVVTSLSSYWDTLGWVYFAKGDAKRAETFVAASWFLSQHAEVGDHLAQIYEKQGRKEDAVRMYAAALAGERPTPEIRTRLANLAGSAAKVETLARTHAPDLVRSRTFMLRGSGPSGVTAEVAVLIDATAKAQDVRFIEGSEQLRSLADHVQGLTLGPPLPDPTAKLVRRGVIACGASGCSLTLVLSGDARPIH